jgi:hypothetical protein
MLQGKAVAYGSGFVEGEREEEVGLVDGRLDSVVPAKAQ